MPSTYIHLQHGPSGLSDAIHSILERTTKESISTILVFDFDRTLTNGFASPDKELPIEKRIRGGKLTLDALRKAKEHPLVQLFVITARSPSMLTIQQLEAAMQNCQAELAEIFIPSTEKYHVEKVNGRTLAWRGPIFAADYAKPIALQQILSTDKIKADKVEVHFFDDFVMNAFDIGVAEYGSHVTHVYSYWWDTYEEETKGMMGLMTSFSSDFPYQKGTEAARLAFRVDGKTSEERRQWYEAYEKLNKIVPNVVKEELPTPAPVSVEVKNGLGNLLAQRGKRPAFLPPAE